MVYKTPFLLKEKQSSFNSLQLILSIYPASYCFSPSWLSFLMIEFLMPFLSPGLEVIHSFSILLEITLTLHKCINKVEAYSMDLSPFKLYKAFRTSYYYPSLFLGVVFSSTLTF